MGQLLKVTSVPMQTMRFSQNARLVPADHVDIERRKAMARHSIHVIPAGGIPLT